MSPVLQSQWPGLLGFIADEGRYVVQIFLVIGGFLAAQSMFGLLAKVRDVAVWPLFKKRFLPIKLILINKSLLKFNTVFTDMMANTVGY